MNYQLSADLRDLLEGLKRMKLPRKLKPKDTALVAFDGRFCSIEAFDQAIAMNASGTWPGIATLKASLVVALATVPPSTDPLELEYADGRIRIGSLTVPCDWQPVSHTLLELPATPDWIEALSLKYTATRGHVLSRQVQGDIRKAERRLEVAIARAARTLAAVGVTEQDVRELVLRRLGEKYLANG